MALWSLVFMISGVSMYLNNCIQFTFILLFSSIYWLIFPFSRFCYLKLVHQKLFNFFEIYDNTYHLRKLLKFKNTLNLFWVIFSPRFPLFSQLPERMSQAKNWNVCLSVILAFYLLFMLGSWLYFCFPTLYFCRSVTLPYTSDKKISQKWMVFVFENNIFRPNLHWICVETTHKFWWIDTPAVTVSYKRPLDF